MVSKTLGTHRVPWLSLNVMVTDDDDRSLGRLVPANVTLSEPNKFKLVSVTVIEVMVQLTVVTPLNDEAFGILPRT